MKVFGSHQTEFKQVRPGPADMPMIIDKELCVGCGSCIDSCPTDAIAEDADDTCAIDPDLCIDCGCCLDECPVEAITETEEMQQDKQFSFELERVLLLYLALDGRIRVIPLFRDHAGRFIHDPETRVEFYIVNKLEANPFEKADGLEELLAQAPLPQRDIQRFFEDNPEFIFDSEYCEAIPQVVLEDSSGERLPDFILRPHARVYVPAGIVEPESPGVQVVPPCPRGRVFSHYVMKAAGLLDRCSRYFMRDDEQRSFFEHHQFGAYVPRLSLIVGRDIEELDEDAYQDLKSMAMGIDITTCQKILARYRSMVEEVLGEKPKLVSWLRRRRGSSR